MSTLTAESTLIGAGRATIYGDYVAPAVASSLSQWHIQGGEPDQALCGKRLTGPLRRMNLHVSLLECPKCMSLGSDHPASISATQPAPLDTPCGGCPGGSLCCQDPSGTRSPAGTC